MKHPHYNVDHFFIGKNVCFMKESPALVTDSFI